MNPEEQEYEQEQSAIPPPDISGGEDDGEPTEEQMMLADLKNRAKTLGVRFHPTIGYDKLREKVKAAMDDQVTDEPEEATAPGKKDLVKLKSDALKLIRIRISNMDPMKKDHPGDFFLTGNALVGTVKRYVPFNVEWHVPQIILNMIQEKKFQQFSTSKNSRGVDITTSKLVRTYAVEILEPLSPEALKELGRVQAMKKGEATD